MRVKIKIGAIEFEIEGDEAEVRQERDSITSQLSQFIADNTSAIANIDTPIDSNIGEPILAEETIHQSFNTFYKTLSIDKGTDLVMAAAYYLYKYDNLDSFTSKDIVDLLIRSHIKRPGNISQSIAQNIKKGLISQIQSDESALKAYQVLTDAEDWLKALQRDNKTQP